MRTSSMIELKAILHKRSLQVQYLSNEMYIFTARGKMTSLLALMCNMFEKFDVEKSARSRVGN